MIDPPQFKALVVASNVDDHRKMIEQAPSFFSRMAQENGFHVDFTDDTAAITHENLARYQVFVMLQLAPFDMSIPQKEALEKFVEAGNGWVGVHAAGLTGQGFYRPDTPYWRWFEGLMGDVVYVPHPAYQNGAVVVEDRAHPATRNLPERFELWDEWYEFHESPRGRVRVLATADEATYTQNQPMGDHPIVWVNESYRRAIYIGIGHDPSFFENDACAILLRDSILWAGAPSESTT